MAYEPGRTSGHVKLSDREFRMLGDFVHSELGIKMPEAKKTMLEARLQKRLRALCMEGFKEYCEYVFSPAGQASEIIQFMDVVTTNKTDFFREPTHFDYLVEEALPELMRSSQTGLRRPLALWSAGCSTGEEPYTLAMVLSDFASRMGASGAGVYRFFILATDVSTRVLGIAQRAVYPEDKVNPVPEGMKKKYLLRSRDHSAGLVRVAPAIRELVHFRRLNFMDGDFGLRERMDVIFCRNVIIYFDRNTQEQLLLRLCSHLRPGGYVFMGHSETLSGLRLPLQPVAPTVYRLPG